MRQLYVFCALVLGFALGNLLGMEGNKLVKSNYADFMKQIEQVELLNHTQGTPSLPEESLSMDPMEDPNLDN